MIMKRDLHNCLALAVALANTAIADGEDAVGNIIDRQGSDALEFVLSMTARTDGTVTPLIEHGDAADLSDAAAVPDTELLGTEAAAALSAVGLSKVGYVGNKRYVRLTAVTAAGTTASIHAIAVKGALHQEGGV